MDEHNWPLGGGATGALVRSRDWSRTGLGRKSQWPQSLRTTVDIVLNSPIAMVLMWGPDHVMVYNDAYAVIAGARHPRALGGTVPGIWPEIWHWNRVILEEGFRGKTLAYKDQHLVLERNGVPEDVWFDLFYTPVRDDRSEVGGVLGTVIEVTARVHAEQRQVQAEEDLRGVNRTLEKEREAIKDANRRLTAETGFLRGLFEQAPSFMAVVRGPGHVFELANAPYLDLVGRQDIVGKPIGEALPEVKEQGFIDLLDRVYRTGEPFVGREVKVALKKNTDGSMAERVVDFVFQPIRSMDDAVSGIFIEGNDVTERSQAEERLRIAQEAGGIGTFEWFPDTGRLVCSDAYRRIWGLAPGAEITADLLVGLVDPADRELNGPARMAKRENPLEYVEYRITRPDTGEKRWLARRGEVLKGDGRSPRRYVGAAFDITERKRSEEALREAEKRMAAIFGQASVGLSELDLTGRFIRVNGALCRMLGRSQDDMLRLNFASVTHPDDLPECIALVRRTIETGEHFTVEKRYIRADGSYVWAGCNVSRIVDELGRPQSLMAVITDISDRRLAEETLRQLNETLERRVAERTEERDRIWRMSQDIMAVASFNGYFVAVNPAFTTVLGWSGQEATSVPLLELIHPADRNDLRDKLAVLVKGQTLVRYEVRDLHKDGSYRWMSWTIVPEGEFLYGVARDITEEKKQREALRHTEEALRQAQKMEAVGQLTGGIAHDFNNLLAAMMGNLEMMQVRIDQGRMVDVSRYIDAGKSATSRAAALTHRLLAFSRRQTLDPKATDVNRLVNSMAELIQSTIGPAIQLEIQLHDGLWGTMCDPNQLENGLLNLAINARDAMPDGGRLIIETANLRIDETHAEAYPEVTAGEYVTISVTDNGAGMAPEVVARAFEPFFTTKPIGQGTGLGLSMVYGFARQSKGHIRIYSERGAGTTVRMKLPRHESAQEAALVAANAAAMPPAAARTTVLVVDDEADLRSLVVEMLEMLGYAALEAADGPEALRLLESPQHIDLLLTDVGLPEGMNGRQLADAARVIRPELKVLFITGYAANAALRDGLVAQGMHVMTKPFALDALGSKLAGMIDPAPAPVSERD